MPKLLAVESSPRGDYSVSRKLTADFIEAWKTAHAGGTVVIRDVNKEPMPFVDLPWIMGAYTPAETHSPESKAALKVSDDAIAEVMAADHIVIGTSMYNLSIPAALKAWIDHIVRINVTFTPQYEGLVKGKKVTVILASGGVYTLGAPAEGWNMASSYMKQILGFMGMTDVTVLLAGGTAAIDMGKASMEELTAPFVADVKSAAQA